MASPKAAEHRGVDVIGLGVVGARSREVPHARRLDDAQRAPGRVQRGAERGLVAAGGFKDDVDGSPGRRRRGRRQPFAARGLAGLGVGQVLAAALQVELACRLGNVDAGVDGVVVLTHACNASRQRGADRARSINGSSLE